MASEDITLRRQTGEKPEATSLLGKPLYRPPVPEATRAKMEAEAAAAFDKVKGEPSAEAIIWFGRRTAYLGKFREAISAFEEVARRDPRSPEPLFGLADAWLQLEEHDRALNG